MRTLELQSLSSALKGFWRSVSQCLLVPPVPGGSAALWGMAALLGLFTLLPASLRKHGVPAAGSPTARLPTGAIGVALYHDLLDSCLSTGDTQGGLSVQDPAVG